MISHIPIPKEKILLQLSGGKDSVACLLYLLEQGAEVEAVHFYHKYGYYLPSEMAQKICEKFNVPLHKINITEDIEDLFLGGFSERPCRFCKSIMDYKTVQLAVSRNFNYICVGDTKDDTMLINRIKDENTSIPFFSRYFNLKVELPEHISIYRPLLEWDGKKTLEFVQKQITFFKRVNDTGDKYFDYSREGCPLQFKDLGVPYTKQLMTELLKYNALCSEFATKKGIRASIHLPSQFIVTIPKGYEKECREFLQSHGCNLKDIPLKDEKNIYCINIFSNTVLDNSIIVKSLKRFLERCSLIPIECNISELHFLFIGKNFTLTSWYDPVGLWLNINLNMGSSTLSINLENLIIEIYHTDRFAINLQKI